MALKRKEMVLRKVAGRMQDRSVSSALGMWRRKVEAVKNLKRRTRKVVMRILKMSAARAFATWGSRVCALRVVRAKERKVVYRLLRDSAVVALETWRQRSTYQVKMKFVTSKIMRRWNSTSYAAAFATWQQRNNYQVKMKVAARKIMRRWMRGSCASAFGRWRIYFAARKIARNTGIRVIARWMRDTVSIVFAEWRQMAQDEARYRFRQADITDVHSLQMRLCAAQEVGAELTQQLVAANENLRILSNSVDHLLQERNFLCTAKDLVALARSSLNTPMHLRVHTPKIFSSPTNTKQSRARPSFLFDRAPPDTLLDTRSSILLVSTTTPSQRVSNTTPSQRQPRSLSPSPTIPRDCSALPGGGTGVKTDAPRGTDFSPLPPPQNVPKYQRNEREVEGWRDGGREGDRDGTTNGENSQMSACYYTFTMN